MTTPTTSRHITTSQVAALLETAGHLPAWLAAAQAAEEFPYGARMTLAPETGNVEVTPTGTCPLTGHSAHAPQACPDKVQRTARRITPDSPDTAADFFPRGSHATVSPVAPDFLARYRGVTGHVCGTVETEPGTGLHPSVAVLFAAFPAVVHVPVVFLSPAPRDTCPDTTEAPGTFASDLDQWANSAHFNPRDDIPRTPVPSPGHASGLHIIPSEHAECGSCAAMVNRTPYQARDHYDL